MNFETDIAQSMVVWKMLEHLKESYREAIEWWIKKTYPQGVVMVGEEEISFGDDANSSDAIVSDTRERLLVAAE